MSTYSAVVASFALVDGSSPFSCLEASLAALLASASCLALASVGPAKEEYKEKQTSKLQASSCYMSSIYTGLHNLIRKEGYNVVDYVQQVKEIHGKSIVFTKGKGRLIFRQYMTVGHVREYMDDEGMLLLIA
jgi:hypothetical protein